MKNSYLLPLRAITKRLFGRNFDVKKLKNATGASTIKCQEAFDKFDLFEDALNFLKNETRQVGLENQDYD